MLELADRSIDEVKSFLAARGVDAGYLVPTETGLEKSLMDAHAQLREYLRKEGLHDYANQETGGGAKVRIKAWLVEPGALLETFASLYRPATNGDPRIWVSGLPNYSQARNVLALLVHAGDLYVANASNPDVWEAASDPSTPLGQLLDKISGSKNRPISDKFSAWNLRLLRSFFSEASKGEEVFLRADKDTLDEIGQDLGGDAGFVTAVRVGPSWRRPNSGLADRIVGLVRQRNLAARLKQGDLDNPRRLAAALALEAYGDPGEFDPTYRGCAAPAYLPYLAMLVRIAASSTGDGFYKQLRDVLGLREQFGSNQMPLVENAWADLERWTNAHSGRFGKFKLRRLGGYQHIGVPQSQSILKPGDVDRIPLLFARAEIRPDKDMTDELVGRAMHEAKSEAARTGTFLSRSFCAALAKNEFAQPIGSILRAIYEDWDGTLPSKKSPAGADPDSRTEHQGLGLCLSVAREEPLEFEPHWRLPAIHDSGIFELTRGSPPWAGTYMGSDEALTRSSGALADEFWNIARASFSGDVQFNLKSTFGEAETLTEAVALEGRLLWLLVPRLDGPDGRAWLRDGELPGYGTAFLLAPPGNVERLRNYLDRSEPDHDVIKAVGIPDDWMLVRLNECSALTDIQRRLPDGAEVHQAPRLLRLVGGRSVRRGYGHMYLPYDLPAVELDAPLGSKLSCPDGVVAIEEHGNQPDAVSSAPLFHPVRRFKLRLRNSGSASYAFEAWREGKQIGRLTLRISGTDGDLVEIGQPFSLDSLGRPQASTDGLSGIIPDYDAADGERCHFLSLDEQSIGEPTDEHAYLPGVEEKFLDALGRDGAMDAGVARKLIERLLVDAGREDNPIFLLLLLRSLGHIELATTPKGHLSRVHAVQPTIVQLPVTSAGKNVHGVTGTLRIAHWKALRAGATGWRPLGFDGALGFNSPRLVEEEQGSVELSCSSDGCLGERGFRWASLPARSIASWCEGLDVVRDSALRNSIESIGKAADGARRFNPAKGTWFPVSHQVLPHELWKASDLDTGLGNIHYLVNREEGTNKMQHAFVRDSRWGVWITLNAFTRYLKEKHGRDDLNPFPITYDQAKGMVWLPARIGLPVALERSLVLCSAALPDQCALSQRGTTADGRLELASPTGGVTVTVSAVYNDMANGKWLAYRWVPESVAALVAGKLGARLDII